MNLETAPRSRRLISLTPLIDVVFILLLFFMLASSFLQWQTIELSAPADAHGKSSSMEGALLVRVGADGGVDLNGRRLTLAALGDRVRVTLRGDPEQRIFVQPASGVELQTLVTVLDRLTAAGAKNISLTSG